MGGGVFAALRARAGYEIELPPRTVRGEHWAVVQDVHDLDHAVRGEHELMGNVGDTISLIPVAGDASGVTTHDLKYPLQDETLRFGPARGISNVITGSDPRIRLTNGRLLVVHTTGRA